MPKATDCWGIEVGSNAIKAIRLQRQGADVSIVDFDVIPFKKILTTPDLDVDEAIRVGLDQFVNRHNLSKSGLVVSVPGHMAFARFAKLPPVEPKKIPDIVRFEAVQQIPFPIEQVEWDYQTFQDDDSPDVEVGIFAITKDRVIPWLSNFLTQNMAVEAISLSPVAVFNALNYDMDLAQHQGGTILMDIGTQATDLVITDAGRLWSRTIPIGGNHFTDALVRSFKLSFSKAEKLKREAATSKYARQIFQAMRPIFVDLVQEVQKSLGYYQSLNRDVELERVVGLGSTWRLPGLQTFLKQQLQMEVSRLDAFKKIEVEGRNAATFAENTLTLAPAYGLALQGLDMETVGCNLLPPPIIRQQVWKAKQPVFIAAAAVAIAATAIAYVGTMAARGAYNSPTNATHRQTVQKVMNQGRSYERQWNEIKQQENPTRRIQNLASMLDYQAVWPGVLSDINQAMGTLDTQPDLLGTDIEKIKAIPRTERRQMFVEELSVIYVPPPVSRMPGPASAEMAAAGVAETEKPTAGSFEVTLTGTTPQRAAADFLDGTFLQWLKENGKRPGRGYEIPRDSVRLANVGTASEAAGEGNRPTPRRPARGFVPGGTAPGGFVPGGRTPGGFMPGGVQPGTAPGATPVDLSKYTAVPPRPLADEDASTDQRFVIQWTVQLRTGEEMQRANRTNRARRPRRDRTTPAPETQP
jgi:type IV pilus assembly protein PilM